MGRSPHETMLQIFKTEEGIIREEEEVTKNCWVALTDPSSTEIRKISRWLEIDEDDLRASLDEEERSRIDIEDHYVMILVDIPFIEERNKKDWYGTIPMSIILTDSVIVTICLQDTPILQAFMNDMNNGWGWSTVELYSGWNCVPMYHRLSGISTISTSPEAGLVPTHFIPAFSNSSLKRSLNS